MDFRDKLYCWWSSHQHDSKIYIQFAIKNAIKSKNLFDFILLLQEFVSRLNLQRDQEVLDLGCGVGGSAFYMANVSRFSDEKSSLNN